MVLWQTLRWLAVLDDFFQQGGGHRARPGSEHRPQEQDLGMEPDPVRKEWRKGSSHQYDRF